MRIYKLTESLCDNDLILAHALAGVVVCKFPCVEEGALDTVSAGKKLTIIHYQYEESDFKTSQ